MSEQLYRIDWKKLTEGLDDKELLFIEGCVEEATIDYEAARKRAANIVLYIIQNPWMSADEYETNITTLANEIVDAAVKGET